MTGLYVVAAAVLLALAFGCYRHLTDGRVRTARHAHATPRLTADRLGAGLGARATFVQFSSSICAPCRATHRLLGQLTADDQSLVHVEVDAETRLDLVEEFGVTRTPTVLLLDHTGAVRHRIVGAPRKPEVLVAMQQLPATA